MEYIINLTQHQATADQARAGVCHLRKQEWEEVKALLTFETIPSKEEMVTRAQRIARIAVDDAHQTGLELDFKAMIGGAPFFMSVLERELKAAGIYPVYAFSVRESEEELQPDGTVVKTNVFKHVGFVGS